jgi:cysteinyl-tRNA synthetase
MAPAHKSVTLLGVALIGMANSCRSPDPVIPPKVATPPRAQSAELPVVNHPLSSASSGAGGPVTLGVGFAEPGPWLSFYGGAKAMGDLRAVADRYRILNIDADPDSNNFSASELIVLQAGGRNRVLSYLNLGSCERFRSYWSAVPAGFSSCGANSAANLGGYQGYPDEVWMDLGNTDYQRLLVEYVAARLFARHVDGFYLDNLELVEHPECAAACRKGALDLVRKIRQAYPSLLLVMQNATSDVTRLGTTGGLPFPTLLDGVAHEEVYNPTPDPDAESELFNWQALGLRSKSGRPFWIGIEDYVGSCNNHRAARVSFERGVARGFSVFVSDRSGGQNRLCDFGLNE